MKPDDEQQQCNVEVYRRLGCAKRCHDSPCSELQQYRDYSTSVSADAVMTGNRIRRFKTSIVSLYKSRCLQQSDDRSCPSACHACLEAKAYESDVEESAVIRFPHLGFRLVVCNEAFGNFSSGFMQ